jgi:proton glutamate symport protein
VVTTFALAVGLIMANLIKPGQGVVLPPDAGTDVTSLGEKGGQISWEHVSGGRLPGKKKKKKKLI